MATSVQGLPDGGNPVHGDRDPASVSLDMDILLIDLDELPPVEDFIGHDFYPLIH